MYKVIKHFIDLHDNDHSYNEGDIFPREGVEELAGSNNKQHSPLIELVEETSDNATDTDVDEKPPEAGKKEPENKEPAE